MKDFFASDEVISCDSAHELNEGRLLTLSAVAAASQQYPRLLVLVDSVNQKWQRSSAGKETSHAAHPDFTPG
jgi:hypothetical protein